MKDLFIGIAAAIISLPVLIALFIFKFIKFTFFILLGLLAIATGQTKASLTDDIIREKRALDKELGKFNDVNRPG